MWMDLESVIHSEVSQKKKKKYCILMHIYGILKTGTEEPMRRAGIETDVEHGILDMRGSGGELREQH